MAKHKDDEQGLQRGTETPSAEVPPIPAGTPQGQPAEMKQGRQRGTDDTFIGRAAQLAVIAELLQLRCNAAIPEVDMGTDVFVFHDDREEVVRLQVKACTVPIVYKDGSGYSAKFSLPMKQFRSLDDIPPLYYGLAVRRDGKWGDFLIVSRERLQLYYNGEGTFGSYNKRIDALAITVTFRTKVECSGRDITDCRNAWASLPPLRPLLKPEQANQGEPGATGTAEPGIPPVEESG